MVRANSRVQNCSLRAVTVPSCAQHLSHLCQMLLKYGITFAPVLQLSGKKNIQSWLILHVTELVINLDTNVF